jgi:hypothetical protein
MIFINVYFEATKIILTSRLDEAGPLKEVEPQPAY